MLVTAALYGLSFLIVARSPATWEGEDSTRPKGPNESECQTKLLNTYYSTTDRLLNHQEFFSRLFSQRYRFAALFGLDAVKPFIELFRTRHKITLAVQMLIMTSGDQRDGPSATNRIEWQAAMGWGIGDEDLTAATVN